MNDEPFIGDCPRHLHPMRNELAQLFPEDQVDVRETADGKLIFAVRRIVASAVTVNPDTTTEGAAKVLNAWFDADARRIEALESQVASLRAALDSQNAGKVKKPAPKADAE